MNWVMYSYINNIFYLKQKEGGGVQDNTLADNGYSDNYIVTISCPASSGIIAAVSGFLASHDCNINEMAQFDDEEIGCFFLRARFQIRTSSDAAISIEGLQQEFVGIAEDFEMKYAFHDEHKPMKVLIMVSRFDHCLADLLYQKSKQNLNLEITAVVSNHLDLRPMVERAGIRFVYKPVTRENKARMEEELMEIIEETDTELVVLARYMQILTDNLCQKLKGRAINIHHSFLPGFKGAKPYHQAYKRGVKLIGATAHYVTSDLDEGPIIEQEVQRVDHTFSPKDLSVAGRLSETIALTRAVRYHIERRVFLADDKTVIFK